MADELPQLKWTFFNEADPYWQSDRIDCCGLSLGYQIGLRAGKWILLLITGNVSEWVIGAEWNKDDVVAAFQASRVHMKNWIARIEADKLTSS